MCSIQFCRIVYDLDVGGWRVAVSYPLLVKAALGKCHYAQQSQTFSVEICPVRWRSALSLLLEIMQRHHSTSHNKLEGCEELDL